jgi:iron complex outermembrane receptor protein
MIDNRPVFNNNLGGTFWESLPIDLNDVDRIEIVRGPSAPLFGPNAVTGVINIITRKVSKDETMLNANLQAGTPSLLIGNLSAGKNFGKLSVIASGNYQRRERFQETYYIPTAGTYQTVGEMSGIFGEGIAAQYDNPDLAMEKSGANLFVDYRVTGKTNFSLSAGTQQSETQRIFLSNVLRRSIPFTTNETKATYVNLAGKIRGLSFRTSYLSGHDNLARNAAPNQYDYNVFDASAEYNFEIAKIGSFVPGISYHQAVFSDEDYMKQGMVFLGGRTPEIKTTSAFVRTDLQPLKSLRILGALRLDKFSSPDDAYLAYELAATFKLNAKNLLRAAVTRSNSGSFIGYNYLYLVVPVNQNINIVRTGSGDLDLYTVSMMEIGYRSQLSKSFHVDFDVFRQTVENLTALQTTNGIDPGNGTFVATEQKFLNVPTTAVQTGMTFSVNYAPTEKLHLKPFVTVQKTETRDLPSSFLDPALADAMGTPVSYSNSTHKNTPSFYGGYYVNFKAARNLNVNLNGYYFATHRQYDQHDLADNSDAGNIGGKFLVNARISYAIQKLTLFVNARNLTASESTEFFGADRTAATYIAGASFSL